MKKNTTILEIEGAKYELNTEQLIKLNLLKKVEAPKPEKVKSSILYNVGDIFVTKFGVKFILAVVDNVLVDGRFYGLACLVSLKDGNRWVNPKRIDNSLYVDKFEWSEITYGENFVRIVKN